MVILIGHIRDMTEYLRDEVVVRYIREVVVLHGKVVDYMVEVVNYTE